MCRILLSTASSVLLALPAAQAETWRFALIGDTPYTTREEAELPGMLAAIGRQPVEFIAHVGDFKSGQRRCDDRLFAQRQQQFDQVAVPFIYIPGDNEWTDCARELAGAFEPVERLNTLRALFWSRPESLGQRRLPLERQPGEYAEHSRFRIGPVLFVTLNLPGGDNHWGMTDTPHAEYQQRNPAVLDWLRQSFALARQEQLRGIVLLFQANPGFRHFAQKLTHRGFRDFLETLYAETLNFPGEVVAVHGDTHISRIDHPLRNERGEPLPRFTRVETHGYPTMGWTLGTIDSTSPTLFRFEAHSWPEAKAAASHSK